MPPTIASYNAQVRLLLHDVNAQFYPDAALNGFIDDARLQIATEGECIRNTGTIATVGSQVAYLNSGITPALASHSVLKIQAIRFVNGVSFTGGVLGDLFLEPRPWEWFYLYQINMGPHPQGTPRIWSPFQHGVDGSFYIGPPPSSAFPLNLDCVLLCPAMTGTALVETLPYPWTEAVQYFAAYMAAIDSQRLADADHFLQAYEFFMQRARAGVTSSNVPGISPGGINSRHRGSPGQAPTQLPGTPPSQGQGG